MQAKNKKEGKKSIFLKIAQDPFWLRGLGIQLLITYFLWELGFKVTISCDILY